MRKRLLAFIIDYLIIYIPFYIVSIIFSVLQEIFELPKAMHISFLIVLIPAVFGLLCKDIFGASIGKKCVKIKVVSKNGRKPNLLQGLFRNITLYIWPVEFLLLLLDKERLGDRLAQTEVVEILE